MYIINDDTRIMCIIIQAFRKRLEEVTMQKTSKTGPPFPVEFSADNIELEIPEPPSGWRMFCLSHPAVSSDTEPVQLEWWQCHFNIPKL